MGDTQRPVVRAGLWGCGTVLVPLPSVTARDKTISLYLGYEEVGFGSNFGEKKRANFIYYGFQRVMDISGLKGF